MSGDHGDPEIRHATAPGFDHPPTEAEACGFVNVARLELDQLLEQLIERVRDVQATQGRLRALLRAYLEVAATVDLDEVLAHILHAARVLVDARYAALGVVDNGQLVRFTHVGMDRATVAKIDHPPEGKGLLGMLIADPYPLRLPEIGAHVASVGFPDGHPPMRSFLGVPIRARRRIFGNLYLTDKQGAAEFSREDEELVTALAAAAGTAIDNAALFAEARRRQQWQAAMKALSTAVLTSEEPDEALSHIAQQAGSVADAAGVSVCVPTDAPDMLRVAAAEGLFGEHIGAIVPVDGTIYGSALSDRRAIVVANPPMDPRTADTPAQHAGPIIAIPMITEIGANGVLFVCRHPGEPPFEDVEVEMLTAYGDHAALMLQLAEARHGNAELRAADDRKQIADDLQHQVIEHLFRLGLDLHAVVARISDDHVKTMINARIDDTDEIIREVREAIFDINRSPTAP